MYKSMLKLIAAGCIAGLGVAPANAETKLTYGSYLPATHLVHKKGLEPFFERLKKDSNGKLSYELFSGGSMGGAKETLQSVKNSIVDSTLVVDVYLRKDLPVSVTFAGLLSLADDPLVFAGAINELHLLDCEECVAEKSAANMKALGYYSTSVFQMMCRDEGISTLADIKGKKIRAGSRQGALAQHLGGVAVSVTTAEMYEALQRGAADCALGSAAWLTSYNLKDVIKSIVDLPTGAFFSALFMNMNKDSWASLSDSERNIIVKNIPELIADTVFAYMAESVSAIDVAVAGGAKVNKPGAGLVAELAKFRSGEVAVASAKSKKSGVKNADALLAKFEGKVKKWRKIVAQTGGDKAKYQQALWTEIYSKVK